MNHRIEAIRVDGNKGKRNELMAESSVIELYRYDVCSYAEEEVGAMKSSVQDAKLAIGWA